MNPQVLNRDAKARQPDAETASQGDGSTHSAPASPERPRSIQRRWLEKLLDTFGRPHVGVELPSGERIPPPHSNRPCPGLIRFVDSGALWRVISDPLLQFGDMYTAGRVMVEGPLEQVLCELFFAMQHAGNRSTPLMRLFGWAHWPRGTTLRKARQNIHHHYDIGNEFYALWLDREMAYTCAYFPTPEATLEEAQLAKFDHVCRKVRLEPGMDVIEAGCGWGGLALHMARHYGVRVQAYNISTEQVRYAQARARAEGLSDRVEFREADWRTIQGRCDVFMSVGMLEHVGIRNYRLLGRVIDRVLKPGGRGLIHSIGQNYSRPASPWTERRIFPGAYAPALSEMLQIFEPNGFSVLDVENIRLHYALTLQHWLGRFHMHESRVREMFDDRFVRMWRFYLAGSMAAFVTGSFQLFQVVFNRAADNDIAWTRDALYEPTVRALAAGRYSGASLFPTPRDS